MMYQGNDERDGKNPLLPDNQFDGSYPTGTCDVCGEKWTKDHKPHVLGFPPAPDQKNSGADTRVDSFKGEWPDQKNFVKRAAKKIRNTNVGEHEESRRAIEKEMVEVLAEVDQKKFKPYIVTIEVDAHDLEEAKAIAHIMAGGDGSENGEVQSVVQKYRMTNFNTEWYKK